jgi:hypothetical protein
LWRSFASKKILRVGQGFEAVGRPARHYETILAAERAGLLEDDRAAVGAVLVEGRPSPAENFERGEALGSTTTFGACICLQRLRNGRW